MVDGLGDRAEPRRDLRSVRHDPADAELHAGALVEVGGVDAEVDRLDPGHGQSPPGWPIRRVNAPPVDVGDLLDRTACRRSEVVPGEVRDGDQARLHEAVGNAEERGGFRLPVEVHGREHRPEAATPQGEHEAPDRGIDRRRPPDCAADVLHARHDQHRHLVQVLHEVAGRVADARLLLLWRRHRSEARRRPLGGQVAVQVGEGGAHRRIGDDEPAPRLLVRTRRRLDGEVEALHHHVERDRAREIESLPYRAGGGEELVDGGEVEPRRRLR